MAFIEKQRHGKHDYYYLVKSVRISPKEVKKVRIFLGRKVPAHNELQPYFTELEKKAPRPYVPQWLSNERIERLEDLRTSAHIFKGLPEEPFPKDFLVRFTYNSNAIEGNPLTLRQTALILADGISPEGSKTSHVMEVLNGKDAWEFAKGYKGTINKGFVCSLQYEVTKNTECRIQGKYRDSEVGITGSDWKPPSAATVPHEMASFFKGLKERKHSLHPLELATYAHNRFVQIHPFTDGNGRTARLLMNWLLMRAKFPPAVIEVKNKERYYKAIESGDRGDHKPFAEFLAGELISQYTIPKAE